MKLIARRSLMCAGLPFTDVCVQLKVMPHIRHRHIRQTQHTQSAFHRFFVKGNAYGYQANTERRGTAPRREEM